MGENTWDPQSAWLESVQTKEYAESRKICEISWTPKFHELETDIIMGSIGDVLMEDAVTYWIVSSIKIQDVKVKAMESKTRHSIIPPEEVSRKFNIVIEKVKDTLIVTA